MLKTRHDEHVLFWHVLFWACPVLARPVSRLVSLGGPMRTPVPKYDVTLLLESDINTDRRMDVTAVWDRAGDVSRFVLRPGDRRRWAARATRNPSHGTFFHKEIWMHGHALFS